MNTTLITVKPLVWKAAPYEGDIPASDHVAIFRGNWLYFIKQRMHGVYLYAADCRPAGSIYPQHGMALAAVEFPTLEAAKEAAQVEWNAYVREAIGSRAPHRSSPSPTAMSSLMNTDPNKALANLLDEMTEVLGLNGSQRCILKGAVVEHLQPFIRENASLCAAMIDAREAVRQLAALANVNDSMREMLIAVGNHLNDKLSS